MYGGLGCERGNRWTSWGRNGLANRNNHPTSEGRRERSHIWETVADHALRVGCGLEYGGDLMRIKLCMFLLLGWG